MTAVIHFVVAGRVVPQGSMKPVRMGPRLGVQPNNKAELYDYRARIALAASQAMEDAEMDTLLQGPVEVVAEFHLQRPQNHYGSGRNAHLLKASAPRLPIVAPDIDKSARAGLDALTGVVFKSDAQVAVLRVRKVYANGTGAQTVITVRELDA